MFVGAGLVPAPFVLINLQTKGQAQGLPFWGKSLERATGFAPVPKPWKGFVLLLHYARLRPP